MDQQTDESVLFKYLPSSRQLAAHFGAMLLISGLLGPVIGPWLINWINPPKAWGMAMHVGDYSPTNVLVWGFAFLMFEALFYTAWLIAMGRKGKEKTQPKSWYN